MLTPTDHNALVAAAQNVPAADLETALATVASEIAALETADNALPRLPEGLFSVDESATERRVIAAAAERAHLTFGVLVNRLPLTVKIARTFWQDWTVAQ